MGSLWKFGLFGAVALLMPCAEALAADWGTPVTQTPVPYEFGSSWYVRGDLGYKFYNAPDAHFDVNGYGNMIGESLGNTATGGLGFGYRLNDYVRTDFTLDYEWPANFNGRLACPPGCPGGGPGLYSKEYARISAWTGLINAYFDMGNWSGFTPYVGGGIGTSYLTASSVHIINPDHTTRSWADGTQWNLAWSLTAGVSYALSKNWAVDVNYRYVSLGDAASGATLPKFNNKPIHYDNIDANEVRIGFRYLIN